MKEFIKKLVKSYIGMTDEGRVIFLYLVFIPIFLIIFHVYIDNPKHGNILNNKSDEKLLDK